MSIHTVKMCDILGCTELATKVYPAFIHGQQKGEDSYGSHLFANPVDICSKHEYEYRKSLPVMRLKEQLAEHEIEIGKWQNPYVGEEE